MTSYYEISGENGKALNGNRVSMKAAKLLLPTVTFNSQQADFFEFFMLGDDQKVDPQYLPEFQQQLTLWKNGVIFFTGTVVEPEFVWDGNVGWQIRVQGGWSELEKVSLSPDNKAYERADGDLSLTITDVLTIAKNGGANIDIGTIDQSFTTLKLVMRSLTCGTALAQLLNQLPDAVTSCDYATGKAVISIKRRPFMPALNLTLGKSEVSKINITPQAGLTPDMVVVKYATADANGVVTEHELVAGAGSIKQNIVLTADGFADFTARATAEQQIVRSALAVANWSTAYLLDKKISDIAGIPSPQGIGAYTYPAQGSSDNKSSNTATGLPTIVSTTAPNNYSFLAGEYREWFSKLAITKGTGKFQATFFWKWRSSILGVPQTEPQWILDLKSAGGILIWQNAWWNSYNTNAGTPNPYVDRDYANIYSYSAVFDFDAISRLISVNTILRDPGDYPSAPPPSNLADSLLAVQAFTPFRGRILFTPWADNTRKLGSKVNVIGGSPRLVDAGAIIQGELFDLYTNTQQLTLGVPSRQGLHDLQSRFRRTSAE